MRTAIAIDSRSATPLHRQIYDAWRGDILTGRFRRGERVPSTRELAAALKVARATVAQAYEQLLAEGYLHATRGSGTFVCRELPDELLQPKPVARASAKPASQVKLSRFGARLTEDFRYAPESPGSICFARWTPDLERFPLTIWRKLVLRALRQASRANLGYSREPQGIESLRVEIAAYVARSRAVRCTPEQVVVLSGSQQALDFCARLLTEPGDEVAFENPGYLGTRRIFEAHGLKLRPARIDNEGIAIRDLGRKSKLAYVTPSHQFPTGLAMSLPRRLELLSWARTHGAIVVEDDYDSEYRYSGPPLPALQGLADDVPVIYCGTFSKVMFPALRIGYVIVPEQLAAAFRRAKWINDRHTPTLEQLALAEFLGEGHLDRHVRRMRRLYGHRREVLVDALTRHFGGDAAVCGDAAGMSVMVRFAVADIAANATRKKVQIVSTAPYYLGKAPANEFLLGFSTLGDRAIREGIKRLAAVP
jgi:GntR family transcriptional regulator/MocR family aminotransferase